LAKDSFFNFKSFKIKQPEKGLKVTTEACLLGALAYHPCPNNLLDIGCGSGLLSIMVAQRFPNINICAVDIIETVLENAKFNLSNSPFSNSFQTINGDYLQTNFKNTYDLIICNPPFFKNHLKSPNDFKNSYLHNDSMPFENLVEKTTTLMNSKSMFWILLPPYQMSILESISIQNNLSIFKKIEIFSHSNKLFRLIYCFTKENYSEPIEEKLILFDTNKNMTEEFRSLMAEYYLNL
jgi:tRNA1Val (adenine37-N6)-methyltransferase